MVSQLLWTSVKQTQDTWVNQLQKNEVLVDHVWGCFVYKNALLKSLVYLAIVSPQSTLKTMKDMLWDLVLNKQNLETLHILWSYILVITDLYKWKIYSVTFRLKLNKQVT